MSLCQLDQKGLPAERSYLHVHNVDDRHEAAEWDIQLFQLEV